MRTKMTISILLSVLITTITGQAGAYIGTVTSMEGVATVKAADGSTSRLQVNAPVYLQDEVNTEAGAKLQITFEDGTVFSQGEKSTMVINEYVYAPGDKKSNKAFFGMIKGVFRVVTDQITKINPEGFAVDTNYGTIGIRGCDLAFVITDDADHVFIVELHTADSVVVNKMLTAGSAAQEMVIRAGGILVSMDDAGMSQQPFPAGVLKSVIEETTPNSQALAGSGGSPLVVPLASVLAKLVQEETAKETGLSGGAAARDGTFVQDVTMDTVAAALAEEIAAELAANIPAEVAAPTPITVASASAPTPAPGSPGPAYPIVGPQNRQTVARGTDWSWGAWTQATTDLVNGTPVTSVAAGTFVSGNAISAGNFNAIASGATRYDLSGAGAAGAAITEGGTSTLVSGSALLNVSVGGGIAPVWQGDFSLAGNGAALAFDAAGSIDGGRMSGNVGGYSLTTASGSHGAPASSSIRGNLVGPGTGARPITGASGQFDFNHGANGPAVQGVFGADLQ